MNELIDELDLTKIVERDKLLMVKYIIKQCLEKEKEQITKAYSIGFLVSKDLDMIKPSFNMADDYYKQAYNKNK